MMRGLAFVMPLALVGLVSGCDISRPVANSVNPDTVVSRPVPNPQLVALEERTGGRLGVQVMREDGTVVLSHRANERFAMCSSFKLPLAGVVLSAVEHGRVALTDAMPYTRAELPGHSPRLIERLSGDRGNISVEDALAATVMLSDNGAANLLLARIDGPAGFTQTMRGWGDDVTRLDRTEPALNANDAGDARDTSSPHALTRSIGQMLYGSRLNAENRSRLRRWTAESPTGSARFRAGLPVGWAAGDKTGTCAALDAPNTQVNDIGWFETPDGTRYLFAVLLDRPTLGDETEAAIADVALLAVQVIDERR